MGDDFIWASMVLGIVVGLPWLILHYLTKWRQAPKITDADEKLLDEMFLLARRLEERVQTVERIAAADHPDWKPGLTAPTPTPDYRLERSN